ncbi:MAG: hypothetical protein ACREVK_12865 [Gammaproteobacteria bacterium]
MAVELEIRDGDPWWLSPDVWTVPGNNPEGTGGVPVAAEIAPRLTLPFDIAVVRKPSTSVSKDARGSLNHLPNPNLDGRYGMGLFSTHFVGVYLLTLTYRLALPFRVSKKMRLQK